MIGFIQSHFPGVQSMEDVNPFARFTQVNPKERTITHKFQGGPGVLPLSPAGQGEGLVSCRGILIRNVTNPTDSTISVFRPFTHPAGKKDDETRDKIIAAMGGKPGVVMEIKPHQDGAVSVGVMKESPEYMYLHSSFVKTFMLITEQNIHNGCIPVPPEVCAAQDLPKVATLFDAQGASFNLEVEYYVLVPYNHVLAWCLRIPEMWRRKKGLFALEMTVAPVSGAPPYILYYVVANQTFDLLKQRCLEGFVKDKHDCRPLNSLGFQVDGGPVSITASFTVVEYPVGVDPKTIAPVLHPDFIPYSFILEKEVTLARGQKEEEEYEKRRRN